MLERYFKVATIMVLLTFLSACGSTPDVQRYLLDPPQFDALNNAQGIQQRIVIGTVEVAPFLAASGIVQARDSMTMHQANYHRWAEPLTTQLPRQLRLGLQQQLPEATWLSIQGGAHLRSLDYRLDLSVDSFHMLANGQAGVSGQWQLRDAEQGFAGAGRFHSEQPLDADGYAALVAALQSAWTESLAEIAQALLTTLETNN